MATPIFRYSSSPPLLLSFFFYYILAANHDRAFQKTRNNSHVVSAMSMMSSAATKNAKQTTQRCALIFLHGLGDSPRGWSHLEDTLQDYHSSLAPTRVKYVFPGSPTIPISINGGASMPGWFDLYDWPIGVGSKDDPTGLARSVASIEEEVQKLGENDGIPPEKIVVGGFSQGGAVALLSCYYQQQQDENNATKRYAGCVGLSAWLTLPEEFVAGADDDEKRKIPLFWGHGTYDDKVLFEQQKFGIEKLTNEFGLDHKLVSSGQYPMGHQSCEQETRDFADFLNDVFFGNDDEDKKTEL